jgi:hypothetical protein
MLESIPFHKTISIFYWMNSNANAKYVQLNKGCQHTEESIFNLLFYWKSCDFINPFF